MARTSTRFQRPDKPKPLHNADTGEYAVLDENGQYQVMSAAQYDASQMGDMEAFTTGFGRTLEQTSGGVMDAIQGLTGVFGDDSQITGETMRETMGKVEQDRAQAFAPIAQASPVATGLGQAAPYLMTAPLGGATVGGQAALAGGMGLLGTSGDVGTRLEQGAISGAVGGLGAGIGNMASRAVNAVRGIYRPGVAGDFVKQGGQVTPGQATDNSMAQRVEAVMESAGVFDAKKITNQKVIQTQAGKALGQAEDAIDLTPTGLGNSADEIGGRINAALEGVDDIKIDDDMIARLQKVKGDSDYIDFPDPSEVMSGKTYQQVRSQMAGVARTEAASATKTPGKLEYVERIINDLDEKFIKVAGDDAGEQLGQAREHWRNLLALERGKAISTDGLVNPRSLDSALNQTWKKTYRRGKNERVRPETKALFDGTRAQSSKALSSVVGDSGTATRLLTGLGLPILSGGAGYYGSGGDTSTALMTMLGTYGAMKGYGGMGKFMAGQVGGGGAGAGRAAAQGLMAQ